MKRIDADPPFCGAAAPPVAAGGRTFVTGISGGDASMQAIDVAAERVAWRTILPCDFDTQELATSLPLPRPDGGAWLAVHQFDRGVVVHGVDGDGRVDAHIDLPREYPLSGAGDLGSKIMLRLGAAGDDRVLCSWTYRQLRQYGITLYASDGAAIWTAPEWLLACDGTVAITCPVPERQPDSTTYDVRRRRLMARAVPDGTILWQSDVQDAAVAALADGTLYLVDRGAALEDVRAQEAAIEARFLDGAITQDALDAAWDAALPRVPMQARAIDAATGRERWWLDAGAQVLGVAVGIAGVAALCHELSGTIRLRCTNLAGSHVADAILEGGAPSDPRQMPSDRAAVVSAGDAAVVLTPERWVFVGFDGVIRATGALPAPCFGFEPRIVDRWLTLASAVVVDGRLVLRADRSVWIV